jgi:hypothetical protein
MRHASSRNLYLMPWMFWSVVGGNRRQRQRMRRRCCRSGRWPMLVRSPTTPREAPPSTSSNCRQTWDRSVLLLLFIILGCHALSLSCVHPRNAQFTRLTTPHDNFKIDASSRETNDAAIKSPALEEDSAVEVVPSLYPCAELQVFRPRLPPCGTHPL